jgi:anti-sigma B factor antagonist
MADGRSMINIPIQLVNGVKVAVLAGNIDGRTAPLIQNQLAVLAEPGNKIVLDMNQVNYMSSAGLRVLLMLYRQLDDNDGRIILAGLREELRDIMSITGFLELFTVSDTVNEALAILTQ